MKKALLVPAAVLGGALMLSPLEAIVLCGKKNPRTGTLNEAAPIRARAACKSNEITLMAFTPNPPVFGNVRLTNVLINGGWITAPVAPGSIVDVSVDYFISDPGCPTCLDQIQVGFAHGDPLGCIYNAQPGAGGVSGSATFTVTAPAAAGTYYLGFDRSQDFSCPAGWWSGAPLDSSRHFATIVVQ